MKAFRFRPEALLELRRRARDAAQLRLARASHQAAVADAAVRESDAQVIDATRRYRERLDDTTDGEMLEWHRNWMAHHQAERAARGRVADERRAIVLRVAREVGLAHQGVRVLERLRARAHQKYREDERREEGKEMDQLAAIQHARRALRQAERKEEVIRER